MDGNPRFIVFIFVALLAFVAILRIVLRGRAERPRLGHVWVIAMLVVAGGMVFAKFGQNAGLPWWIYYTVPMLVTVFLPPVAFRMNRREMFSYWGLAFLSSPMIHVVFSFFVGWKDYMPFIPVPSLWELL